MSDFLDAISGMFADAREVLGEEIVTIEGIAGGAPVPVSWNQLAETQTLEIAGRSVRFNVTVQLAVSESATAPQAGKLVTKAGKTYRIAAALPVETDLLTHTFVLDTAHR